MTDPSRREMLSSISGTSVLSGHDEPNPTEYGHCQTESRSVWCYFASIRESYPEVCDCTAATYGAGKFGFGRYGNA